MAFGPGNWELLSNKARLINKDAEVIEEHYNGLMAYAEQTVKECPNPYSNLKGRKRATRTPMKPKSEEGAKGAADGGEEKKDKEKNESEEEEEGDLEVDEEEEEEEEKPKDDKTEGKVNEKEKEKEKDSSKSDKKDEDEDAGEGNAEDNPYMITPIVAHRLVDRVKLWTDIREKLLPHAQLAELLEDADVTTMPNWWLPGEHDVALLQSIEKYGIGNMGGEWDAFIKDKDCIFMVKSKPGLSVLRKQKEVWMQKFVEDRFPLISRLNYYRRKVLGISDVGYVDSDDRRRGKKRGAVELDENSAYSKAYRTFGRERKRRRDDEPATGGTGEAAVPGATSPATAAKARSRIIYRDAEGKPILPIRLKGGVLVHNLGQIDYERPGFHSKQYLWPIGFMSTRKYPSIANPSKVITYTSRIVDKGGNAPSFEVEAEDMPGQPFCHATSSGVWVHVLKQIKNKASVSVSGPEMFGYSDLVVKKLFQELPNADKCKGYIMRELDIPSLTLEEEEFEDAGDSEEDSNRKKKNDEELKRLVPMLKELGQELGIEQPVPPEQMSVTQLQQQLALLKEKLKKQLEGGDDEDDEDDEEELEVEEDMEEDEENEELEDEEQQQQVVTTTSNNHNNHSNNNNEEEEEEDSDYDD